jgi:hypothetical protein
MTSKDVHILIPEPIKNCVMWHWEIEGTDRMKFANQLTLRQEEYSGLSWGAQCNLLL